MNKYTNIDEYIANFSIETQVILEKIRAMARKCMPSGSTEAIRYGIPTFRVDDKNVVHFAGYESHIGLYPASDEVINEIPELKKYRTGKGTFQFELSSPIPYDLIEKYLLYKASNAK